MSHIQNMRVQAMVNTDFRKVIETGQHMQVALMSIPPGGEIGEEVHQDSDQVLYIIDGAGTAVLDGMSTIFNSGDLVIVPAGMRHNFITQDGNAMKLIVTYSPPHHPNGTVHTTKADSDAAAKAGS
jgi:mannose-6-phosphate isomerase-like protein (cupin superfamily)